MLWLRIFVMWAMAILSTNITAKEKCGPYDGVDLTDDPVLLEKILKAHHEWLVDTDRDDVKLHPKVTHRLH